MGIYANTLKSISEMTEVISLCTLTQSVDYFGAGTETFSSPGTPSIRAKIRYDMTNEAEDEKQERLTEQIKVWIRYGSGVTKLHKVYWDSKYWDIYGLERTPNNDFHVLKCRAIE